MTRLATSLAIAQHADPKLIDLERLEIAAKAAMMRNAKLPDASAFLLPSPPPPIDLNTFTANLIKAATAHEARQQYLAAHPLPPLHTTRVRTRLSKPAATVSSTTVPHPKKKLPKNAKIELRSAAIILFIAFFINPELAIGLILAGILLWKLEL